MEPVVEIVLDARMWPVLAMLVAMLAVLAARRPIPTSMNLFYGCLIGVMAAAHLLAVTVKLALGSLRGSLALLYPLGLALAVPAWWLVVEALRLVNDEPRARNRLLALNLGLAGVLVAAGPFNVPLAVPAALNVAHGLCSRDAWRRVIVRMAILAYAALFVGAVAFLASGQSFEQLRP